MAESDAALWADAIWNAEVRRMSAVNYVEASIIIDGRGSPNAKHLLDRFLVQSEIQIESVTPSQALAAREAYRDYGKGRHRASLNLGDCFAYALAKAYDEPLLFKGNDFSETDVRRVLR